MVIGAVSDFREDARGRIYAGWWGCPTHRRAPRSLIAGQIYLTMYLITIIFNFLFEQQVGRIIGKGGQNVREMQRTTSSVIKLPEQVTTDRLNLINHIQLLRNHRKFGILAQKSLKILDKSLKIHKNL